MGNSRKEGRIVYVEPNNIISNTMKSYDNNAIMHPYEDYCIGIDLEVFIGDRYSCGINGNGFSDFDSKKYMGFSSEKGTLSFMGGKDKVLTTEFTDINMNDPSSNTKECLGIESINITYNSWMYPNVVIKFTDVRGASLFLPQEQRYYNNPNANGYDINASNFYASLFTFPYPLFRLKVKGFYGNPVTYDLSVEDFQAEFDSSKGNFNITVKFVGYMYGIYNDIPLSYIAIAPYIDDLGKNYWTQQINNGTFRYLDVNNHPSGDMVKFPEYKTSLARYSVNSEKLLSQKEVGIRQAKNEELTALINNIKSNFPLNNWYISPTKHVYYRIENNDKYKVNNDDVKLFVDYIKKYNETFTENKIDSGLINNLTKISYAYKLTKSNSPINGYSYTLNNKGNNITIDKIYDNYPKIKECIENVIYIYIFEGFDHEFNNKINKVINNLEIEKQNIDETITTSKNEILCDLIGFNPTIKNIYNMTFAHMDTFMEVFYTYLRCIKDELEKNDIRRKVKHYGININNTDVTPINGEDTSLPPFPMFYKEKNINNRSDSETIVREPIWPGDMENGEDLWEVKFVYDILNASKTYQTEEKVSDKIISKMSNNTVLNSSSDEFIPITVSDLLNHKNRPKNAYDCVLNKVNDNSIAEYIIMVFMLRAYNFFLTYKDSLENGFLGLKDQKPEKMFGKLEAENLTRVINGDKVTKAFIDNFLNMFSDTDITVNKNNVKNILIDQEHKHIWNLNKSNANIFNLINNKGSYGNSTYNWLIGNGKYKYLPINNYNINDIQRDSYMEQPYIGSDNYINITNPLLNNEGCEVIEDLSWLDEIYGNVNVSDDIKGFLSEYEKYIVSENVSNIKRLDGYYNIFYALKHTVSGDTCVMGFPSETYLNYSKKKNIDDNDIWFDVISSVKQEEWKFSNLIKDNRMNNFVMSSIFGDSIYYYCNSFDDINTSIKMKAYLFLMGVPYNLSNNSSSDSLRAIRKLLKIHVLKEGAIHWVNANIENNNIKEVINLLSNKNYKDLINNNKLNYLNSVGNARKDALIAYFENWVSSDFSHISKLMELRVVDNNGLRYLNNEDFNLLNKSKKINFSEDNIKYYDKIEYKNGRFINLKLKYQEFSTDFVKLQNILWSLVGDEISIIDRNILENANEEFDVWNACLDAFNHFIVTCRGEGKYKPYIEANNHNMLPNRSINMDPFNDKDLRLATYMTLKNLYDRWICANNRDRWKLGNYKSDFNQFKYIDTYFHDIGNKLMVNASHVGELVKEAIPTSSAGMEEGGEIYSGLGIYEFLSLICQKNQMVLMPLPIYFGMDGSNDNGQSIADMFDAKPYNSVNMSNYNTSTYFCLYSYEPSSHLNIENDNGINGYINDGFDIADTWGNIIDLPAFLTDDINSNYIIPAFGVTYAKQNQSYFTDIKLNMGNSMVTEYSIAAAMNIAAGKNIEGDRQTTIYGQDLYRVFSNYSYSCDVESLGNAQILPMMYFQLNNIPMWKGAYYITKVEHNISAGNMKTNFTGVRLNKNAIPLKTDKTIFLHDIMDGKVYDSYVIINETDKIQINSLTNFNMTNYLYDVYYNMNDVNGKKLCEIYGPYLERYMVKNGITQAYQIAMFTAQIGVESGRLKYVRELGEDSYFDMYEPIFDKDGKNINKRAHNLGNNKKGDGLRYKGRGLIQLTGKNNYKAIDESLGTNFLNFPQELETPENAAMSACWYWSYRKLNSVAGDLTKCTERINGGLNGYNERKKLYDKALTKIRNYYEFA